MGNMEIIKTKIDGVYIIKNSVINDIRGTFTKTYNEEVFNGFDINKSFKESYYTVSKKNVIRGMHFQKPPFDHEKLVYVPKGKIIDVILDLRQDSDTYKRFISVEISESNGYSMYIPKGLAHGFKSLMDNTIAVYQVSTIYNPIYDSGIRWDSFGMDWNVKSPIISDRDKSFDGLDTFKEIW